MAKSVLAGVALSDWNVGNAREVIDACMGHVESRELIDEFWRSTKQGYFINLNLDRLLYAGSAQIAGATMAERHALAQDEAWIGLGDDKPEHVHHLHVRFLRLIGAEDLLPLAEKVYQTNKAIVAIL